jgi:hypothetical protein
MDTHTKSKICKISLYDKLLIGLILLFAVGSFLSFKTFELKTKKCLVYHNGSLLEEIDLRKDGIKELHVAEGRMKLEVSKGRIRVLQSSCPRGLCIQAGWITTGRMPIVCVPNKILIEIKGCDYQYDAVSQ